MEDANSRKTVQDSYQPPAEPNDGVTPVEFTSPVERSTSLFGKHGLPSVSGNTSSSLLPGSVEMLTTFMQDMYNSGRTESDIWKNCEARWLQLFSLVEKQCQEQISAQQEQFHQQIQLIQDEIKHLVKLQSSSPSWKSCAGDSSVKPANNLNVLGIQTGQRSGFFEGNRAIGDQCSSSCESEMGLKAQESFSHSISATSGYGTISLPEPNPARTKWDQNNVRHHTGHAVTTSKEHGDAGLTWTIVENERNDATEEDSLTLKPDQSCDGSPFSQEGLPHHVTPETHKVNENEQSNCKPLTSWAQKVKQSQQKKPSLEKEGCSNSVKRNDQTEKLTFENIPCTDSSPSQMFFLGRQSDSPNSFGSEGSGLTYWKLEEKELYHSLPENFEHQFSNIFSNKLAIQQPISISESKLQSLKGIYESKLRENNERPAWSPPDQSNQSHPPEVWTLDPTVHMKPGQQNPELPSHSFSTMEAKIPFTPDSILESSSCSQSDRESFSNASNMNSSTPGGSPNILSQSCVSSLDLQRNRTFQGEPNVNTNFLMRFGGSALSPNESVIDTEDDRSSMTLTPPSAIPAQPQCGNGQEPEYNSFSSVEHPIMLSRIRQNLREKHARHIADMRDYYESEIHNLKRQLEASNTSTASEELRKTNQSLVERCDQLEDALTEASTRLRTLENKNNGLEMQVADWRERFHAVTSTSNILQERVEEMRASNKEKDNTISRLKSRLKELEEAFQKAYKLSEEKDGRIKHEQKMFQDLLAEYESLGKEHERVKDTLSTTESRRLDANREISELKRTVSKLEAQLKQAEHENMVKLRHIAEDHLRITNVNRLRMADVSRRKWLAPESECSIFTGQPLEKEKSAVDNRLQETYLPNGYPSPPEKDLSREHYSKNAMTKDRATSDTPIMKAFKEFEEGNALKNWGTQTEKMDTSNKVLNRRQIVGFVDSACGTSESPERYKDQKRTKRFNSPSSQRSSSLPPSNRRSTTAATPTKREIMLMPVSVKYSPKRSPRENLSPGLSQLLSDNISIPRFDVFPDDPHTSPSFQGRSPRKKLQFFSLGPEEHEPSGMKTEIATCGPASEENTAALKQEHYLPVSAASYETEFTYKTQMKTLVETERLFDELIQEKQQIEAALNRIPCSGGRLNLQARYNKEALEDRLERINRDLGSIRMTLKKFHVLRTSANI